MTTTIAMRPDALLARWGRPQGRTRLVDRVASIADRAEAILGGRAWIRQQPHGLLFITRDPADTLLFPTDHARSGESRYRWETLPSGDKWGWLVEGATDA